MLPYNIPVCGSPSPFCPSLVVSACLPVWSACQRVSLSACQPVCLSPIVPFSVTFFPSPSTSTSVPCVGESRVQRLYLHPTATPRTMPRTNVTTLTTTVTAGLTLFEVLTAATNRNGFEHNITATVSISLNFYCQHDCVIYTYFCFKWKGHIAYSHTRTHARTHAHRPFVHIYPRMGTIMKPVEL